MKVAVLKVLIFALKCAAIAAGAPHLTATAQRVNTADSPLRSLPPPSAAEISEGKSSVQLPKNLKIPPEWEPLLNKAFEEYWMEGNHKPDAGFVLFARNPNKETAKLWLMRMESKAVHLQTMFPLIAEVQKELVEQGYMKDRYHQFTADRPKEKESSISSWFKGKSNSAPPTSQKDLSRLEYFFLFSETCPHCARLAETLTGFPNVAPLQVTKGPLHNWPGLSRSEHANEDTLKSYFSGEVPILLIFDPKTRKMVRLTGNKTSQDILLASAAIIDGKRKRK